MTTEGKSDIKEILEYKIFNLQFNRAWLFSVINQIPHEIKQEIASEAYIKSMQEGDYDRARKILLAMSLEGDKIEKSVLEAIAKECDNKDYEVAGRIKTGVESSKKIGKNGLYKIVKETASKHFDKEFEGGKNTRNFSNAERVYIQLGLKPEDVKDTVTPEFANVMARGEIKLGDWLTDTLGGWFDIGGALKGVDYVLKENSFEEARRLVKKYRLGASQTWRTNTLELKKVLEDEKDELEKKLSGFDDYAKERKLGLRNKIISSYLKNPVEPAEGEKYLRLTYAFSADCEESSRYRRLGNDVEPYAMIGYSSWLPCSWEIKGNLLFPKSYSTVCITGMEHETFYFPIQDIQTATGIDYGDFKHSNSWRINVPRDYRCCNDTKIRLRADIDAVQHQKPRDRYLKTK